jgi:hypothetical protein
LTSTHPETQTNLTRLAQLLPNGKHSGQTERVGWVAAQPAKVLHLVPIHREKKPERKRKNLIRLGVDPDHAYQWSRTRIACPGLPGGGWATAQSPILGTTITLERLRKRGYEALLTYYEKIAPSRCIGKPLYTRTAWFTLSEAEVYSGVRGAPVGLMAHRPSTRLFAVNFVPCFSILLIGNNQPTFLRFLCQMKIRNSLGQNQTLNKLE